MGAGREFKFAGFCRGPRSESAGFHGAPGEDLQGRRRKVWGAGETPGAGQGDTPRGRQRDGMYRRPGGPRSGRVGSVRGCSGAGAAAPGRPAGLKPPDARRRRAPASRLQRRLGSAPARPPVGHIRLSAGDMRVSARALMCVCVSARALRGGGRKRGRKAERESEGERRKTEQRVHRRADACLRGYLALPHLLQQQFLLLLPSPPHLRERHGPAPRIATAGFTRRGPRRPAGVCSSPPSPPSVACVHLLAPEPRACPFVTVTVPATRSRRCVAA